MPTATILGDHNGAVNRRPRRGYSRLPHELAGKLGGSTNRAAAVDLIDIQQLDDGVPLTGTRHRSPINRGEWFRER